MTRRKLSARAAQAVEILQAGGCFIRELETDRYTGRTQFQTRLWRSRRGTETTNRADIVKGCGFATLEELKAAGLVRWAESWRTSGWPSRYVWHEAPVDGEEAAASELHIAERDYV